VPFSALAASRSVVKRVTSAPALKVKPYILRCQLIHTIVPAKEISFGRAPAKCGKGGSFDVLVHSNRFWGVGWLIIIR
jgi:hypothetical protein